MPISQYHLESMTCSNPDQKLAERNEIWKIHNVNIPLYCFFTHILISNNCEVAHTPSLIGTRSLRTFLRELLHLLDTKFPIPATHISHYTFEMSEHSEAQIHETTPTKLGTQAGSDTSKKLVPPIPVDPILVRSSKSRKEMRAESIELSKTYYTPVSSAETIHNQLVASFQSYKTLPLEYRLSQLHALENLLQENEQAIEQALALDLNRVGPNAYITEISTLRHEVKDAIKNLPKWMEGTKVPTPLIHIPFLTKCSIVPEPIGTVLILSPWNYPIMLALHPLIGAIAAGCCALVKPSSISCHVSTLLVRLFPRYLDPSCYQLVTGGHDLADKLLTFRWDHIFFTGSVEVGRTIQEKASHFLCPVTLELGGKSPCIVDASANIDVAARRIAMGKWMNAGQTCVAPDYVIVCDEKKDELVTKLKECIVQFFGAEQQKSADFGRMVSEKHYSKCVDTFRQEGWAPDNSDKKVEFGGFIDEDDLYIQPTIITCSIDSDTRFLREEIFAPFLLITSVPNSELSQRAKEFIHARPKPLSMYVFSTDPAFKEDMLRHTSSGSLTFNETVLQLQISDLPFGGVGESGMGKYHGKNTFEIFTHQKSVLDKTNKFDYDTRYPPYTSEKTETIKKHI
ncbi:putative Aldehyde dehydrogenase family 3 member A2 [Blattamonas nauphoetae]|uniref:Aldehyde dehydrogenase family 3 member A2 n=1 Tax=Blattamonas nauphoetae TaxID=2049346 RepID=A0ABQ9YLL9_9EUKA|nr:putative Aldehyde dehydrogenase family 3 member A2 [Blattamonas nauphoetae]